MQFCIFKGSYEATNNLPKYIEMENMNPKSINNFKSALSKSDVYQGWGQVQLTKYSSTPSTPTIYQVQVLVKYSFF